MLMFALLKGIFWRLLFVSTMSAVIFAKIHSPTPQMLFQNQFQSRAQFVALVEEIVEGVTVFCIELESLFNSYCVFLGCCFGRLLPAPYAGTHSIAIQVTIWLSCQMMSLASLKHLFGTIYWSWDVPNLVRIIVNSECWFSWYFSLLNDFLFYSFIVYIWDASLRKAVIELVFGVPVLNVVLQNDM